jgi:hypothetical protein
LQSTQVQFSQVHFGLPQLRAASPQLQSTQVHGSQVHAGFSQVVAMLTAGSPLSPAHVTTSNAYPTWHGTPARACALTQSLSVPAYFLDPN